VVAGAVTAIGTQLAVAAAYWGVGVLGTYGRAILLIPTTLSVIEPEKQHLHSWRAFFQLLGLSQSLVTGATLAASIATLVVAVIVWRSRGDLRLRFAVLLTATVLVNPHMYVYDLLVLTSAGIILWDYAVERRSVAPIMSIALLATVGLSYVSPLFEFAAPRTHVQVSVVAIVILFALVSRELWHDPGHLSESADYSHT
jgi:hypothetical protein